MKRVFVAIALLAALAANAQSLTNAQLATLKAFVDGDSGLTAIIARR